MENTPTLKQSQQWLKWVFTNPRGAKNAVAASEGEPSPRCLEFVADVPPIDRYDRLDIYGKAYYLRLIDYLLESFPVTAQWAEHLGQSDALRGRCADYIREFPSHYRNIDAVGKHFGDFLLVAPPSPELSILGDMAKLEWAVTCANFSDSVPANVAEKSATLTPEDWEKATFAVDPSLQTLNLSWPITEIWREQSFPSKLPSKQEECAFVWRDLEEDLCVREATSEEFEALRSVVAGAHIWQLTNTGSENIGDLFRSWVEDGIIRDINLPAK